MFWHLGGHGQAGEMGFMMFKKVKHLSRWSLWYGSTAQITGSYRRSVLQPMERVVLVHTAVGR